MKITVINGTEKKGVTYKIKEMFLEKFRESADIEEYYLPDDCPNFCVGCTVCFNKDENLCKDRQYIEKIEKSLLESELLVFTSPAYVMHATGALKALLDHFGYRWMPHRPAKEMFSKRAVVITQCLGAGAKSTAKDIKDSLSWWGVSDIRVFTEKLMGNILWDKLKESKRQSISKKIGKLAGKMYKKDYSRPAHTSFVTKCKFFACRMIQKSVVSQGMESADAEYWKAQGWFDKGRPWKS